MENTLIPVEENAERVISDQTSITSPPRGIDKTQYGNSDDNLTSLNYIDKLFPSPGIIVRDIYEIFKTNKPLRERDSALVNYIKLLFQNQSGTKD